MLSTYIGSCEVDLRNNDLSTDPDTVGGLLAIHWQGVLEVTWMQTGPDNLSVTFVGSRESVQEAVTSIGDDYEGPIHVILDQ